MIMRRSLFSVATLLGVLLLTGCFSNTAKVYSPDKKICVTVDDSTMTVKYNNRLVQTVRIDMSPLTGSSRIVEPV